MSDADFLLRQARAFAAARGLRLTYVSKLLFGDWRRIDALDSGKSFLRPPTLAAALERMAALEAQPVTKRSRRQAAAVPEAAP